MSQVEQIRGQVDRFGLPTDNDKVAKNIRVVQSTVFFAAAATLTNQKFFVQGTSIDGTFNNFTFPSNDSAISVLGLSIHHNLKIATTPADIMNKGQAIFEQSSWLNVGYNRRNERLSFRVADLVPWRWAPEGSAYTQYQKQMSQSDMGFLILPERMQVAAKTTPTFDLNIPSPLTLAAALATTAGADPAYPGQSGKVAHITLSLLIEEQFVAVG